MRKTALITSLAISLIALPTLGAQARPGPGPGSKHGPKAGKRERAATQRRCARMHKVGFVAVGDFVSFAASAHTTDAPDAGELVVDVRRASRHARSSGGQQTFSTAGARVRLAGVTDSDGDGAVGLVDARAGDRVKVVGKLLRPKRGCQGERRVLVRTVKVKRRGGEPAPTPTAG